LRFDVTDATACEAVVERITGEAGALDIVVHAAGIARDSLFALSTSDDWDEALRVNLGGALRVVRAAIRPMIAAKRGAIVFLGSGIKAVGDAQAAALASKLEAILATPEGNRAASAIAALTALGDTAAVPAIAAHLNDRSTDTKWNAKLALDALAGPARGLPEWQEWARGKGYLPANGTKQ
jgi:NAD(P)-dependent dehydrogenase (short-subunit alcohol dehydrogenase family)